MKSWRMRSMIWFRESIFTALSRRTLAGFFMVYASASMPMAVSIPVVLVMTVLLGVLIERAAYKPLRSAPRMSVMISAIGVSYLLQNLATYITGGLARPYPEIITDIRGALRRGL